MKDVYELCPEFESGKWLLRRNDGYAYNGYWTVRKK